MQLIYVKLNAQNCIIDIESDAVLTNTDGWVKIDEGEGDPYVYAKMYLPLPVRDEYGVPRYKLVNGVPVERTSEEMEADRPAPSEPEESAEERISALEDTIQMLTDCILEMSETIYA